jgi:hypothetical protein
MPIPAYPIEESGCWPTQSQELILRAALLRGSEALDAWNHWKQNVNPDKLDAGTHRMVPQLYRNLCNHGVEDPLMERFNGIYSRYLQRNEALMQKAAQVLEAFHEAGIPTILLKGAALIQLYYKDSGCRPMNDVDVLIPTKQARASMAILKKLDWKSPGTSSPETWIPIRHSIPFEDRHEDQFDLHWHLLWECWHANDDEYWETAKPITINNIPTLTLNSTHQLLHTCWHGARWNEVPPIRWIADAMAILEDTKTEIDWNLLISQAQRHRIILLLKECLEYLKNLLGAPVPDDVIESLQELPVSRMERIAREAAINPLAPSSSRRILLLLYNDYRWLTSSTSAHFKSFAFARFLQDRWNIEYLWQVPPVLSVRLLRRAFRR